MARPGTPLDQLTNRETDVARLMARGYTNPQIAEELDITFATAKWHVSQVIAKLGASSREEAGAIWAGEQRWSARARRGLAALEGAALLRLVAVGAGSVVAVAAGVFIAFAIFSGDDSEPTDPAPTPTIAATPSATGATATPAGPTATPDGEACAEENLINGLLVIGEGEAVPDCALESFQPLPPVHVTYRLDVPPDEFSVESRTLPGDPEGGSYQREGTFFLRGGEPFFAFYQGNASNLRGRTIEGSNPVPVDYLPAPGVMVERADSVAVYWLQDMAGGIALVLGIELFDAGADTGLSLQELAGRLTVQGQGDRVPRYWAVEARVFVETTLPPWLYGDDVAHVDAIIRGYPGATSLEPFADTVAVSCGERMDCAPGNAAGTAQEAVLVGTCEGFSARPATERTIFEGPILPSVGLFGVANEVEPEYEGVAYSVFLLAGTDQGYRAVRLLVTDAGVAGLTPLCPVADLARWVADVESWLKPPAQAVPE